jgi:hypothetical protein
MALFSKLPSIAPIPDCAISLHLRLVNLFFLTQFVQSSKANVTFLHINSKYNKKEKRSEKSLIQIQFPVHSKKNK